MRKVVLFSLFVLLSVSVKAQVLYSENFNNYNLGNIGSDANGVIAGQGNWYTWSNVKDNSYFQIITDNINGKCVKIQKPVTIYGGYSLIEKRNLDALWNTRNNGNEVLKIEYDFYAVRGQKYNDNTLDIPDNDLLLYNKNDKAIAFVQYNPYLGKITAKGFDNLGYMDIGNITLSVFNKWYKVVLYIDYSNKTATFEVPALGYKGTRNLFTSTNVPNIQDYYPSKMNFSISIIHPSGLAVVQNVTEMKYDNVKITALDTVPLAVFEPEINKFSIFPNPASSFVSIKNDNNIIINDVDILNINGELIKEFKNINDSNVDLNLEYLSNGSYILKLNTSNGIFFEKIIKR